MKTVFNLEAKISNCLKSHTSFFTRMAETLEYHLKGFSYSISRPLSDDEMTYYKS